MRWILFIVMLVLLVVVPGLGQGDGAPWWNDRVFYEVFVRGFYDSDGDGIGDITGLIEKLDYLNDGDPATTDDLGITGLWLMPIFPSPSYHGYDVTDYRAINPEYGTMDDFRRLLDEAHSRGIVVILDFPINHTSSQHPWFVESMNPDSEYADWYVWEDEDPGYGGPWGQEVWHESNGRYYYGVFWGGMPDLNYENPDVTAEIVDVSGFWLEEVGVDGFRLDAIKYVIPDDRVQENTPQNLAWLEQYQAELEGIKPNVMLVGEIWDETARIAPYVDEAVHMGFEFRLAEAMLQSADRGVAGALKTRLGNVMEAYPSGQWATFLTNHDQNRIMSQLNGNVAEAKVTAAYLLTLPGVPFIYYGEEIGMQGVKPDEDIRLPMQWSAEENAGFTKGDPWRDPHLGYEAVNVAAQADDPDSLLSTYRDMIHLRNDHDALRRGDLTLLESGHSKVVAYLRQFESQSVLMVLNIDDEPISEYVIRFMADGLLADVDPILLYGAGEVASVEISNGKPVDYVPLSELPPQSVLVIQLTE